MAKQQMAIEFPNAITQIANGFYNPEGYKGLAAFHKYWGKKPTECWEFLIHELTVEGDLVVDPFLGSGLIAREALDLKRKFIGIDINPLSIELSKLLVNLPSPREYKNALERLRTCVKPLIDESYQLENGWLATHYLWQHTELTKVWRCGARERGRVELEPTRFDIRLFNKYEGYHSRHIRSPKFFTNSRINVHRDLLLTDLFTGRALRNIDLILDFIFLQPKKLHRPLFLTLTAASGQMTKMVFAVRRRGKMAGKKSDKIEVGSWVIGYWRPPLHFEVNVWNCFENRAKKLLKAIQKIEDTRRVEISASSAEVLIHGKSISLIENDSVEVLRNLPNGCVKLVLTDPPHGDRIPYLELSEMWNAILGKTARFEKEIVISNALERNYASVEQYEMRMVEFYAQATRVLVDNGCLALLFNARERNHWRSIKYLQNQLHYIGCFPMNYSAGSVVQDNRRGGLKQDYVLIFCKDKNKKYSKKIRDKFVAMRDWTSNLPKPRAGVK